MGDKRRTLVGVLASFDSEKKNTFLAQSIKALCRNEGLVNEFHFIFTGGTFDRLFIGGKTAWNPRGKIEPLLQGSAHELILKCSTRLPERRQGGVIVLADYL